jgi:hypothetical protein
MESPQAVTSPSSEISTERLAKKLTVPVGGDPAPDIVADRVTGAFGCRVIDGDGFKMTVGVARLTVNGTVAVATAYWSVSVGWKVTART